MRRASAALAGAASWGAAFELVGCCDAGWALMVMWGAVLLSATVWACERREMA